MVYKKFSMVFLLLFIIFISVNISAFEITSFDITVNVKEPEHAIITERWNISFYSNYSKSQFKNRILEANISPQLLEQIDIRLRPKIYINEYYDLKVGFDEVNDFVSLEYSTDDVMLIKYLDSENDIIWKFNDGVFRYFVSTNLYVVPSGSILRISLEEPFIVGETAPKATESQRTVYWTGISSNELRLIAIEKKPPKPTFVVSSIFEGIYLKEYFTYFVFALLAIVIVLLIFKKRISRGIKKFVVKHSKITSSKNRKEVIDLDHLNK